MLPFFTGCGDIKPLYNGDPEFEYRVAMITDAAVGSAYYDNPDDYDGADYYNKGNTYCAVYREELVGFMAGYTAVKLGYNFTSTAEAAAKTGGKIIGVDTDQSLIIDAYGEGMADY